MVWKCFKRQNIQMTTTTLTYHKSVGFSINVNESRPYASLGHISCEVPRLAAKHLEAQPFSVRRPCYQIGPATQAARRCEATRSARALQRLFRQLVKFFREPQLYNRFQFFFVRRCIPVSVCFTIFLFTT